MPADLVPPNLVSPNLVPPGLVLQGAVVACALVACGLGLIWADGRALWRDWLWRGGHLGLVVVATACPILPVALGAFGLAGVLGAVRVAGRPRGARAAWDYGALVLAGFGLAVAGVFLPAESLGAADVLARLGMAARIAGLVLMAGLAPMDVALGRACAALMPGEGRFLAIAARVPMLMLLARMQGAGDPSLWRGVVFGFGVLAVWCDAARARGADDGARPLVAFDLAVVALAFGVAGQWVAATFAATFGVALVTRGVGMAAIGRVLLVGCLPPMPGFAALIGLGSMTGRWSLPGLGVLAGGVVLFLARLRMPVRPGPVAGGRLVEGRLAEGRLAEGRLADGVTLVLMVAFAVCGGVMLWRIGGTP